MHVSSTRVLPTPVTYKYYSRKNRPEGYRTGHRLFGFFNAVAQNLGLFWMKKFSKQIHYFYTTFTKIKHGAWHGNQTSILKKTLFLSKGMTWCILGAVWVVNLFWKPAGNWSLPGKGKPFPMVRAVAALGGHQGAFPSQQQSKSRHSRDYQGSFVAAPKCFVPCALLLCDVGRENQGLQGWAGASQGSATSSHSADCDPWAAQTSTPQMETEAAFFTQHFKDFHVVLNSWTRTYNPK